MSENTPKSKQEMEETLKDLQIDPEDLDAVAGGGETCSGCYNSYSKFTTPSEPPEPVKTVGPISEA